MNPTQIRTARKTLGLSQAQFAKMLGVTNVTISRWEKGKFEPLQYHIKNIKRLLAENRPVESVSMQDILNEFNRGSEEMIAGYKKMNLALKMVVRKLKS
jgi:predicted transcriptional regulator